MTLTPSQAEALERFKQKVLAEAEEKRKQELSERMRKLGQSRSPKKIRAARKTIQIALAARGYPKKKRKKKA